MLRIIDNSASPELAAEVGVGVGGTPDITFNNANPVTCSGLEIIEWPDSGAILTLRPGDGAQKYTPMRMKVAQGERITFPADQRPILGVVLLDNPIGGKHRLTIRLDTNGFHHIVRQPHGSGARCLCDHLAVPAQVLGVPGTAFTEVFPFPVTGRPGVRVYLPAGIDPRDIDVNLYHDDGGVPGYTFIGAFNGGSYDRYDAQDPRGNAMLLNDWHRSDPMRAEIINRTAGAVLVHVDLISSRTGG